MATHLTKRFSLVQNDQKAMNGQPIRSQVTITNPQGFHLRPQSAFVQLASQYKSAVRLYNEDKQPFDGKSPFSLLGLLAEQGTQLTLEVCGPDQEEALQALVQLIENFSEFEADESDTEKNP